MFNRKNIDFLKFNNFDFCFIRISKVCWLKQNNKNFVMPLAVSI